MGIEYAAVLLYVSFLPLQLWPNLITNIQHVLLWHSESTPLAEWQSSVGSFRPFLTQYLKSQDSSTLARTTYNLNGENYQMHVLPCWGCLSFLCIADAAFSQKQAFSFLTEFYIQFRSEFRPTVDAFYRRQALPVRYELNSTLQPFLSHTLHRHNTTKLEDYDLVVFSVDDDQHFFDRNNDGSTAPREQEFRSKVPLLVHSPSSKGTRKRYRRPNTAAGSINPVSAWLLRHPYLAIGLCIFVGVGLLLYFLVIVPLCGPRLEKKIDDVYVCWFSTPNGTHYLPPIPVSPPTNMSFPWTL